MNKKFLSAILFGALAVASTGSFVSCKDYDDDIKNLQTQIGQLASKSDLQSQVGALETSLTAAKSSAESAVKTATEAVAAAKAAADKAGAAQDAANAATGAASDAKDAAEKAAQAVKDAEAKLAAAEEKVANIEAELASVKTLKAELEAYTEAEIAKLQEKINTEVAALNAKVQALVGLHYVDLMISNAYPEASVSVNFATFKPSTLSTKLYKKVILPAFPELAEIEGKQVVTTDNLSLLVSPAVAEMKPEYTYELINAKEEALPISVANPKKGLTRASGSEYWTLDVEAVNNKDGKIEEFESAAALRVSEGEEVLYKTSVSWTAEVEDVNNQKVVITPNDGTVKYASSIELVNEKAVKIDADNKAAFEVAYGYKDYYVITVDDAYGDFVCEKYGVSVEGSKLLIKKLPENVKSFTVKVKMVAVGLNGTTDEKTATLTIVKNVDATVELAAKSIEIGNDKTYTLFYSVEDLGLTPSQLSDNQFMNVDILDADDKSILTEDLTATVALYKTAKVEDEIAKNQFNYYEAEAIKAAKYVGVAVAGDEMVEGEYTIELSAGYPAITFKAAGNLTATSAEAIKLVSALVKDGVLQAVGTVKKTTGNGTNTMDKDQTYVEYDIEQALIFAKNAGLTNGEQLDAEGETIAILVDNDATEIDNWVDAADTQLLTVFTNGKHKAKVDGEDQPEFKYSHINKTVRNMTVNYYVGNEKNVKSFDFKVMIVSPIYSEDAKTITVENQTIYFDDAARQAADKPAGTAPAAVEIKKLISNAVFAAGKQMGQTYNVFQSWKESAETKDKFVTAYDVDPYNAEMPLFAFGEDGKLPATTTNKVAIFTDKDGVLIDIPVSTLKAAGMLDADAINFLEDDIVYLSPTSAQIYYKTSGKLVASQYSTKKPVVGATGSYYADWKSYNDIYAEDSEKPGYFKDWKYNVPSTANDAEKEAAAAACKAFNAMKSILVFKSYDGKEITVTKKLSDGKAAEDVKDAARYGEISKVTVKFDDPKTAAKFIYVESADETETPELTDPYKTSSSCTITARENTGTDISSITDGSVDIPGTITIKDAYGLEMKVAFKVTAKIYTAK